MMRHARVYKLALKLDSILRTGSWFAVCAWAATIIWLSSLTPHELERLAPFQFWDKAAHFLAFATGAVLLAAALRFSTNWSWKRIALIGILAISLFGATDEWHQLYTPKRSGADPLDWLADTLGAAAGVASACIIHARRERKRCLASAAG